MNVLYVKTYCDHLCYKNTVTAIGYSLLHVNDARCVTYVRTPVMHEINRIIWSELFLHLVTEILRLVMLEIASVQLHLNMCCASIITGNAQDFIHSAKCINNIM